MNIIKNLKQNSSISPKSSGVIKTPLAKMGTNNINESSVSNLIESSTFMDTTAVSETVEES